MKKALMVRNGRSDYGEILEFQRGWAEALAQDKVPPLIWIGRHNPVITIGKRGDLSEINNTPEELSEMGIGLFDIERGGLATVHGPGQLVAYPIWPFKKDSLGVKEFVWRCEEAMIRTLNEFGLESDRNELNPGVWVWPDKIGFVGLAIKHGVLYHGLSLNLNLDLHLFELIIPCGLDKVALTSAAKILGQEVDMDQAGEIMGRHLAQLLEIEPEQISLARAKEILAEASGK